jgi:cell filamentation protein
VADDPYVYPGTTVLKNKLGFRNVDKLDKVERRSVADKIARGVPTGDFDLAHLKAIHHHLFQDIYVWAGKVRTVEIAKGGSQFMFRQYIETGMADVHKRIVRARYFKGTTGDAFAREASVIIGDVNHVHPFREGNGRAQLQYLKQLAERAGHRLDLGKLDRKQWIVASRDANRADYGAMEAAPRATLAG